MLNILRYAIAGFRSAAARNTHGVLGCRQPTFDVAVSALACRV
jgi:hypothetical protein